MKRRFLLLAGLVGGCYGNYPVTAGPVTGREVQLTLTDSGSVVLASKLGAGIETVSGRIVSDSSGIIALAVAGTRDRGGNETIWKGENIAIPRPLVAVVAERRFSRARTALFGGALATALYALREAFGGAGGSSGGSGLPTGTGAK